jgi:hypothetical protein
LTDEGPGDPRTLTFYRIVETDPPTVRDFLSQKARGRPLRFRTARALRLWEGVSVYRSRYGAAALAGRSPRLGAFVAEIRVTDDGSFRYELDNGPRGHCTIWGDAASLLALVVSVRPAQGVH